jgi:hypothetical protein
MAKKLAIVIVTSALVVFGTAIDAGAAFADGGGGNHPPTCC